MSPMPIDEQECQQDALRRVNSLLGILEERITALLRESDPQEMKPAEREQAASRHLALLLRLLQARQRFAQAAPSPGEQALLDALLKDLPEE